MYKKGTYNRASTKVVLIIDMVNTIKVVFITEGANKVYF